jgi:hypothetical protein
MKMDIRAAMRDLIEGHRSGREGAGLVVVFLVVLVLGIFGVGVLKNGEHVGVEASRDVKKAIAFWTAEAGLEHLKAIIKTNNIALTSIGAGYVGTGVIVSSNGPGFYTVKVEDYTNWSNNSIYQGKKYWVTSRGICGNATSVVSMCAKLDSFGSWMHVTVRENSVRFNGGDVIDGPVYVNDKLTIAHDVPSAPKPRFLSDVFSTWTNVVYNDDTTNTVFEKPGSPHLRQQSISNMFSGSSVTAVKISAASGGLSLSGNQNITFGSDGSIMASNRANGAVTNVNRSSFNGAIYVNSNAYVRGVVTGTVTLAAQRAIYITTNIVYNSAQGANDPWTNTFDNTAVVDSLGLIASNAVRVMGTKDIKIHAAILVTSPSSYYQTNGFCAVNWSTNISLPRPNIYEFGSIAQYSRGAVGQGGTDGFNKKYKFDSRFSTYVPPYFPLLIYQYIEWSQSGGN